MTERSVTMVGALPFEPRRVTRGAKAVALGILAVVAACKDDIPLVFRTDHALQYNIVGGERLAVPANYIDSQSIGSMLVIATWPEMEGRTKQNYQHYRESHISIHARPGGAGSLDSARRVYLLGNRKPGGELRTPEFVDRIYGFEHSVVRADPGTSMSGYAHRDIYVRRNKKGEFEAVMVCDGDQTPENLEHFGKMNSQCQLFIIFQDMPNIQYKINFDRSEHLASVTKIEHAVRVKFLEFKKAGTEAYLKDDDARKKFNQIDGELTKIRSSGTVYPHKGGRAGEWIRNLNNDSGYKK